MENCIFRISRETAEWLTQLDLTESERRLVVKKIWEMTNARNVTKSKEFI